MCATHLVLSRFHQAETIKKSIETDLASIALERVKRLSHHNTHAFITRAVTINQVINLSII